MSLQSNIIHRSGNLDQTRAEPFLTAVSGLVGKVGDKPMVLKCRSCASRQVLIGDQLKAAKALGSEVPPRLLGRDKLAILEPLGHGRPWIKRVALFDRRLPGNFRYALLATEIARHRNMSRWVKSAVLTVGR